MIGSPRSRSQAAISRRAATDGVHAAGTEHLRAPTAEEERDARWLAYDGRRRALLERVEALFEHVRLPGGRSPTEAIRQSQQVDDYGAADWTAPAAGEWHAPEARHWQDLTPAGVRALFCGVGGLNFMAGGTFRFFLPAVARLYLQEQERASRYDGPWFPLFHVTALDARRTADLDGYAPPQQAWLAEFFAFATRPGSFASRRGRRAADEAAAWQGHWRARLPAAYLDVYGDA